MSTTVKILRKMSKVFINLSNLHTNKWPEDRLNGAKEIAEGGEIINMAFPILGADASKEEVYEKALQTVEKIVEKKPDVVFCQGEFSLCFRIVELLKEANIKTVTVCNERVIYKEHGREMSGFKFIQFREF